jgi:SAM-dependent methyltransferase
VSDRPLAEPYARYAAVYDRIGQRAFGERMAEALLAWLPVRRGGPGRAVDLACGTGAATLVLAAAGWATTGVDRSAAMLDRARWAAEEAGLRVGWLEQDLRAVDLPGRYDLATCFYDSVNYLIEEDELRGVFRRVAAALADDGLFAFDVNTRRKLRSWTESAFVAVDEEDLFGVYQAAYDDSTHLSPLTLTFFVRDGSQKWDRFDEVHVERGYALAEIGRLLAEGGLAPEAVVAVPNAGGVPRGPATEESLRVLFVARRARDDDIPDRERG